MTTLYIRDGETYQQAPANTILERARHLIAQRFRTGSPTLTAPDRMREFVRLQLGTLDHEIFAAMFLDNRHRLIEYVELFRGTLDNASVYPREVVKETLARNAAAVVFVHNHPSGNAEPSQADELLTHRLKDALALVDVRVVDHLIVGERIVSFAERGLL